jgi:hypothetical protein
MFSHMSLGGFGLATLGAKRDGRAFASRPFALVVELVGNASDAIMAAIAIPITAENIALLLFMVFDISFICPHLFSRYFDLYVRIYK